MLVQAQLLDWPTDARYPMAKVDHVLGRAGDIHVESKAILQDCDVDESEFSEEVLACLPATPWSISTQELARRRDFRSTRIFSIDPPTARDLDDALSVVELGDGLYRVGVHIADVSHFVPVDSRLVSTLCSCIIKLLIVSAVGKGVLLQS